MADSSGDELAEYGTSTTPFRKADARGTKPNGNGHVRGASSTPATAGPSTQPAKTRARKKRSPTIELVTEVDDDVSEVEHVEVHEINAPLPNKKQGKRPASRQPDSDSGPVAKRGGHTAAVRGKGKGRAEPSTRKAASDRQQHTTTETVFVDDTDDVEEIEIQVQGAPQQNGTVQTRTVHVKGKEPMPNSTQRNQEATLQKQLERANKKLQEVIAQRHNLATQLQEVLEIRKTEPEQSLMDQAQQYEVRLKTQEEMIQELTSQLARVDSLTREGKTSTLHFLTREAAEEERRGLEKELRRLQDVIKGKDSVIAQRDSKILDQEKIMKTLQSDLDTEIANSKAIRLQYSNRDPPSSLPRGSKPPGATSRADDFKNGKVIRLYEDITNLLVINVKHEQVGNYGGEEFVYNCIFTHANSGKGLNFTLRTYQDMEFAEQPGEAILKIVYTPLELDKEPDKDFVQGLQFLSSQFTFVADQLQVFLKTINDTMDSLFADDDADAEMIEE